MIENQSQLHFAMQVYWSSLFILPKGVICQVEKILMSFLWKGGELNQIAQGLSFLGLGLPSQERGRFEYQEDGSCAKTCMANLL
jgi:hypothetical protein